MEILRTLPIGFGISHNMFELSEEYITPTVPTVGVFLVNFIENGYVG